MSAETPGDMPASGQADDAYPLPPPTELSARYLKLHGGDINSALDRLGEETFLLHLQIKPLQQGMRLAGLAVTWNAVLGNSDPMLPDDPRFASRVCVYDHIFPGSVLVYQPGGEMSSGHLGNLYGNMIRAKGGMGAVVDGNLRDADGHLSIPEWNPFARGASPLEAASRIKWMEINKPIYMSGELRRWIPVHPGDFVFGDSDGVIIVPRRLVLSVLELAEETNAKETLAEQEYAAGVDPRDVQARYGVA